MTEILITTGGVIAALCWAILAVVAMLAVFSRTVKDTLGERAALAAISITSAGTSCRVIAAGWVSEGGLYLAVALAIYALVIVQKHVRASDTRLPWDKSQRGGPENLPHPKGTP